MPSRSPVRWLAPLSLVACALAVLVILTGGSSDDPTRAPTATASDARPATTTTTSSGKGGPSRRASTYEVRRGDVLSVIAQRTGVPVARLQELNPDVDAQTLRVGQRLKLRE